MIHRQKTGFLFDLDGVIIDSEKVYTTIWNEIDSLFPTGVENFALRIKGTTLDNILNTYFHPENHRAVTDILNEREHAMSYTCIPGSISFLAKLKELDITAILVTSSNKKKMSKLWRNLPDLRQYFAAIIDSDCVSHSKPHPEGYQKGVAAAGTEPQRCVVFEDSLQGMHAGKAAGCHVVGIRGTIDAALVESESDIAADSLGCISPEEILAKFNLA